MTPRIYLDHNATTPLVAAARGELLRVLSLNLGNPSSVHAAGRAARAILEEARDSIARTIGAASGELVFTSGGTEANNLVLFGFASGVKNGLFISSEMEHPSVVRPLRQLAQAGHRVHFLPVDDWGRIQVEALARILEPGALVSIQSANQETGTIQPLKAISAICERAGSLLHVDASQSFGKLDFAVDHPRIDFATLSGHKVGGPIGIGALYARGSHLRDKLRNLFWGGSQEFERRPGTTPYALAKAFSTAVEMRSNNLERLNSLLSTLRDSLCAGLTTSAPTARVLTPLSDSLPHTLCCAFPSCDRLALTINLDLLGICVSPGSACSSGSLEPSPVLAAMGVPEELARGAIRVSFGPENSQEDVVALLSALPRAVELSSFLGHKMRR